MLLKIIFDYIITILRIVKSVFRGQRYHFDRKERKRILIFGNGPSYKEFDFKRFYSEYDLMCVNWFPLKEELFWELKPQYLCIIDPGFFQNQTQEFQDYINCLNRINWKMGIICPQGRELAINNSNIDYIKLNTIYYGTSKFKFLFYKYNMANFGLHNVLHGALFAAINMNYKEIYLTGTDYSEIENVRINRDNDFVILTKHGYGNEFVNVTKRGIYKKGEFYRFFLANYEGLKSFREANEYAEYRGCKIYNLVLHSYIDAFEKKELR